MKTTTIILTLFTLLVARPHRMYSQGAEEVIGITMTVSNLERSIHFYESVLSFRTVKRYELPETLVKKLYGLEGKVEPARVAQLQLGNEIIELQEFPSSTHGRSIPIDARSNDLWFQHIAIVVKSIDSAYALLRKSEVQYVSTSPQTLPAYIPAAAGISAFYFRDPDAHNLEIISFPFGRGNPKWQTIKDKVFLGIDHTAIAIGSTSRSRELYEGALGLKVGGQSENYGTEQEHLNQVFGAHLLISGLYAPKGIGVEFLHYLAPPGGRLYPLDTKASDLWYWHTTIRVNNINAVFQKLKQHKYRIASPDIVSVQTSHHNYTKAFIVYDNDNHAILITGD